MSLIFKIVERAAWQAAEAEGIFYGAEIDLADGYIHFSTEEQLRETAEKHFKGRENLLLVAVEESGVAESLKYEPARNGALFPHLYGTLDVAKAAWVKPFAGVDDDV